MQGEKLHSCYICKRKLPHNFFRPDHGRKSGLASKCNDCSPFYAKYLRRKKERIRIRDKQKEHANYVIRKMIKDHLLEKLPCEICGYIKAQAHHDDYNKPTQVIWLCQKHRRYH
jgi:hypothetical protein